MSTFLRETLEAIAVIVIVAYLLANDLDLVLLP